MALETPAAAGAPPDRDQGERVFVLAEETPEHDCVYLSQRDVRELQFAKAAIATGWKLLVEEFGADPSDIQQVLLAGSFGTYLSARNAVRIGLVPRSRCSGSSVPATSRARARRWRCCPARSGTARQRSSDEIEYVELSDRADFNDRFVDELAFPQ